jgi:hypothetical protein
MEYIRYSALFTREALKARVPQQPNFARSEGNKRHGVSICLDTLFWTSKIKYLAFERKRMVQASQSPLTLTLSCLRARDLKITGLCQNGGVKNNMLWKPHGYWLAEHRNKMA